MKYVFVLIILLLVAGCVEKGEEKMEEKILAQPVDINLRTNDDFSVKGTFYPNEDSNKGLILLHQFRMDRTSWKPWILKFQKDFNVIAIDLRGHGQSQGSIDEFSEEDFVAMKKDVQAAYDYLKRRDIQDISIIGASIGANHAQNFASANEIRKAVLLSPGKNYHGILLDVKDNAALMAASEEDTYSYNSVKELESTSPKSEFIYLKGREHGTNMLDDVLIERIISFLNN